MAAPTFDSVTREARKSNATVSHYVDAYWYWEKLGPYEGAKAAGFEKNVQGFLTSARRGAKLHYEAFLRSTNVK